MYISKLKVKNYRCFSDFKVDFNDKINVIIGHNCTGKSNLIKAMALIFDQRSQKRLTIHDFNKFIQLKDLKESPPKVSVTAVISQSCKEIDDEFVDRDLATIGYWLTKLEEPYEAKLTYEFFLPADRHKEYEDMIGTANSPTEAWQIIEDEFIRLYTYKLWGGELVNRAVADSESLQKFDFQFLDAVRDVKRDMVTGRSTMLKDILDFYLDYDIKKNIALEDEKRIEIIKDQKKKFSEDADKLIALLQNRLESGKNQVLKYAKEIGALFEQMAPDFLGSISEKDLFPVLELIVKHDDMLIPISHNGLGYNNLIYIVFLLSQMQIMSDGEYLGSNAKVFPMLVIEEPEAHLHPTMQYQFLSFLSKNMEKNKVRQVFVTTHSTHITASVLLDDIICLYKEDKEVYAAYPGSSFEQESSKRYVERFLDATKSDMLFAEKVILVEGITEQLLLPVFAEYLGEEYIFAKNHVAVINVGGSYFDHFLQMFEPDNPNSIKKKIVYLTDVDPSRQEISNRKSQYKSCYPFEYGEDVSADFNYKNNINTDSGDIKSDVRKFNSNVKYGKTFEYDLALANPSLELLLTEYMSNREELRSLMNAYKKNKPFEKLAGILSDSAENDRITEGLRKNNTDGWDDDNKKKALIAARYQNSVNKGAHALELAHKLKVNLENKGKKEYKKFKVPQHIEDLIKWVCNNENN